MSERLARWHSAAETDLRELFLYIAEERPATAERFLERIEHAIDLLLDMPGIGRLRDLRSPELRDVRSLPVRGFETIALYYRPCPEGIEVVRILHGARDID